jgi:hypothetical protein
MKLNRTVLLAITLTTLSLISAATPSIYTMSNHVSQSISMGDNSVLLMASNKLKVECPEGKALASFALKRSGNNFHYNFKCIHNRAIKTGANSLISRANAFSAMGSGKSTVFLDRQNVACPGEYGIKSFVLNSSGRTLSYSYVCVKIATRSCLAKESKSESNGGNEELAYLDRQSVAAETNQFLNQFQLHTRGANYVYGYKTCTILDPPTPAPVIAVEPELRITNTDNQRDLKRRFR